MPYTTNTPCEYVRLFHLAIYCGRHAPLPHSPASLVRVELGRKSDGHSLNLSAPPLICVKKQQKNRVVLFTPRYPFGFELQSQKNTILVQGVRFVGRRSKASIDVRTCHCSQTTGSRRSEAPLTTMQHDGVPTRALGGEARKSLVEQEPNIENERSALLTAPLGGPSHKPQTTNHKPSHAILLLAIY